jgi:hypothetical protein
VQRRWAEGGQVIVRDREQSVSGLGRLTPGPAAAEVDSGIPFVFNRNHFAAAWRRESPAALG